MPHWFSNTYPRTLSSFCSTWQSRTLLYFSVWERPLWGVEWPDADALLWFSPATMSSSPSSPREELVGVSKNSSPDDASASIVSWFPCVSSGDPIHNENGYVQGLIDFLLLALWSGNIYKNNGTTLQINETEVSAFEYTVPHYVSEVLDDTSRSQDGCLILAPT